MVQKTPQFYSVLGNRDHLWVDGRTRKAPIWEFFDHDHFLSSLVYAKNLILPPHRARMIWDCGAWSYKLLPVPKWTPAECLDRYSVLAVPGDIVTSPDHMPLKGQDDDAERAEITLRYAQEFLSECPADYCPMVVTHGQDVDDRERQIRQYLDMGYRYIALGGLAARPGAKTFITALLERVATIKQEGEFYVHALGLSSLRQVRQYREIGCVDSFDGSSMFFTAFTGANYLWPDGSGGLTKHSVKNVDPETIPYCECPACSSMRTEGFDTRQMGSNENNMGRAVHNIFHYLAALKRMEDETWIPDQSQKPDSLEPCTQLLPLD